MIVCAQLVITKYRELARLSSSKLGNQREPLLQSICEWRRCEWRWISGTFAADGHAMKYTLLKYPIRLSLHHYPIRLSRHHSANDAPIAPGTGQRQTDATRILKKM